MKTTKPWLIGALVLSLAATFVSTDADAKRLGGGKSTGTQRSIPERTSPNATPATTPPANQAGQTPAAAPGQQAAPGAAAAATGTAAAAGKRSWLGPIAGLAAGLGIAALMSHLGLGEAFGNFLMLALLAVAVIALVVFIRRRMMSGGAQKPALAGAGTAGGSSTQVAWPTGASPKPVSESPMQRTAEPSLGSTTTSTSSSPAAGAAAVTAAFVPASFDSEGFERIAKAIFIRMQAANDSGNLDDLRQFTTPEMFAELKIDLLERGSSAQATEVKSVDAKVVDLAEEGGRQVVSVRYRGEVVEAAGAAPDRFDEVWHLVRPVGSEGGWLIAGIEQMR